MRFPRRQESLSFLGHIERGTRKLSVETFISLCEALECSPNDLIGLKLEDGNTLIGVLRTILCKLEYLQARGLLDIAFAENKEGDEEKKSPAE